jgi:hypothetical protein
MPTEWSRKKYSPCGSLDYTHLGIRARLALCYLVT